MDEILRNHGISQEGIYRYKTENQIGRETFPVGWARFTNRDNIVVLAKNQFNVDSIIYQRFFERHNLLDENVLKGIKNIAKKYKPVM